MKFARKLHASKTSRKQQKRSRKKEVEKEKKTEKKMLNEKGKKIQ
jgi:hypothetical protein